MNRLQLNFYTVYPTIEAPYSPVLIDLRWTSQFIENCDFVKLLKLNNKKHYTEMKILQYFDNLKISNKKKSIHYLKFNFQELEEKLPLIHRQAAPDAEIFWQSTISDDDQRVWIATERFFWFFPPHNLGSARHMLLKDLQLKGSGRSPLALRTDFHHTWGGQYFWQALKGYILSHLLEGALPQGILYTPLISILTSDIETKKFNHSLNSLMIREANDLRITQVATDFDQELKPTKIDVQQSMLKESKSKNFDELFSKIVFHYASMLLLGLRHTSVTRENIMIKGSLMDYEDIENHNSSDSFDFHYMTKIEKKQTSKNEKLFTSTFHFYLEAIILTSFGLNFLGAKITTDRKKLKKILMKQINQLAKTVFDIDQDLIKFMDQVLELIPGYDRDVQKYSKDASLITKLKHKLKLISGELVKKEVGLNEIITHRKLKFHPIKFKSNLLREFRSHQGNVCVLELTQQVFKILEIELLDRKLNLDTAIDLSSKVHEFLSLKQLVYPFELRSRRPKIKFGNLDEIIQNFKNQGIRILELNIFRLNENKEYKSEHISFSKAKKMKKCEFLLLGLKTQLPHNQKIHFFTQPGILIKMK